MSLQNSFDQRTRDLFRWKYECWLCRKNTWSDLHHILGRVSVSALNAAPLCHEPCHLTNHCALTSFEMKSKLLKQTLSFLQDDGYVLSDTDKRFMEMNEKYYE